MTKRTTIKEIAELSGVSAGTVDRIIHNRGNVSERSRAAVDKVLAAIGYAGDDYFADAAKRCSLAILTPTSTVGDYWSAVYEGIHDAVQSFRHPGITLDFFHYNQFDVYSCLSAQSALLRGKPDGVIIAPTFLEEAQSFCSSLDEAGIPYVFVDSHFDNTNPLAIYTTDQISAGRAMAHLLTAFIPAGSQMAIFESKRTGARLSTNSLVRRDGFIDYLKTEGRENELVETCYTSTIPAENEQTIKRLLQEYKDLRGIAVLNSRGSAIAGILEQLGSSHIKLISFDLTMENMECLKKGSIRALLCQQPFRQGAMASSTLVKYVMSGEMPQNGLNLLPIDIVLKETMDFYKE